MTNVYLELWRRAAATEHGIKVRTDKKRQLTNLLYEARKGHAGFDDISIAQIEGDLIYLVKPTVERLLVDAPAGRTDTEGDA